MPYFAAVVFVASVALMTLQLAFARLLAPFLGSTLTVWASLIGAFLGGGALGSLVGGRLALRGAGRPALRKALLGAAACAIAGLGLIELAGLGNWVWQVPFGVRVVSLTTVVGLPVSILLSLVVPLTIQLALADVGHAGRTAGVLSATGTLGSLAGTFLTGFVLIPAVGVDVIVLGVAATLGIAALAPQLGRAAGRSAELRAPPRDTAKRDDNSLSLPTACRVAALAGFVALALEVAATRLMAPLVGVSLYTWTGVIGVVLAGLAAGNAVGGWLADRFPRRGGLVACLLVAGLATVEILVLLAVSTHSFVLEQMPLVPRTLTWSFGLFFLPVALLGTVSPQVIRLAVPERDLAGGVAGAVYAWATAGALGGAFLTAAVLIPVAGVYRLVLILSLLLAGAAVALGRLWKQPVALLAASLVLGAAVTGLSDSGLLPQFTMETAYYAIRVEDGTTDDGRAVRKLSLDRMVHSLVDPADPEYLGYEHETVHAELARLTAERVPAPRLLVIGGGGYTFPRWAERHWPRAAIDVVEIDPGVTEVAHRELGFPRETRVASHAADGRLFLAERGPAAPPFDLIIMDAVNDMSVPFHLLTVECNNLVKRNLAPGGVYLMSIIDDFDDGQLLRAAAHTLRRTFARVCLLAARPAWSDGRPHGVFVLAASDGELDLARASVAVLPDAELAAHEQIGRPIVLTDRYAPVEQLLAGVFRRRT